MDQNKAIARRIAALREDSGLTPGQIANETGVTELEYTSFEDGSADIPLGWLSALARYYGVSSTTLLTGSEPHGQVFHLTRKGTGPVVERRNEYHYESLAAQFENRVMEPFVVTVSPKDDSSIHLNSHSGDEFNYVLSGKLLLRIDGHDLVLESGDSLYFDSSKKHGMAALDGMPATFLAIIAEPEGFAR